MSTMQRALVFVLAFYAVLACSVLGLANTNVAELSLLDEEELLSALDQDARSFFEDKGFIGMAVAVVKDGHVAYLNYGEVEKGGDAITEHTIFEIASLTKIFTGTLLADLSLQDVVGLDTPLNQFFPDAKTYKDGVEVTLSHLATHSSGFSRDVAAINPMNPFANFSRADMENYLTFNAPRRVPGTAYEYSNLGMAILGEALGDAFGSTYAEALKERILAKLDMDSSAFELDEHRMERKAKPHLERGTPARSWDFDALRAAGGLRSTTRDLARFMAANVGGFTCDEDLSKAMHLAQEIHFRGQRSVGLGWHIGIEPYGRIFDHNGLVGGYCSTIVICPAQGVGVVVLVNNAGSVDGLARSLLAKLAK
ncbi:MAG: beta-lactamase family protein [Limnochordia bacterium]|nr:beta-lactamase family protein [Limnochordia bacterium]